MPGRYRKARDLAAANNIDLTGMRLIRDATTATTSIASLGVALSSNEATVII
jgi:hypothetical protein